MVSARPASAGAGNCGSQGFYFDGSMDPGTASTTYVIGTSALITVEGGIWCTNNYYGNAMGGWTMLTGKLPAYAEYAQAGWWRMFNSPTYPVQFSQFAIPESLCQPPPGEPYCFESNFTSSEANYGSTYEYSVSQGAYGDEDMWVGAYKLQTTSYAPGAYWLHPLGIQDLGEVHNYDDGMIGKPFPNTSHWTFVSAEVLGYTWQKLDPTYRPTPQPVDSYSWPSHDCGGQWCFDTWSTP